MHSPANPVLEQFEQLLGDAAATMRVSRVRSALSHAFEISSAVLLTASLAAIAIRVMGMSPPISWRVEIAGFFAAFCIISFNGIRAYFSLLDVSQVAERLDLAAGDGNAIAAALEFVRGEEASPFAYQAIDAGLMAARSFRTTSPVVEPTRFKKFRVVSLLFISITLFAFSQVPGIWPTWHTLSVADRNAVTFSFANTAILKTPPSDYQTPALAAKQTDSASNADGSPHSKSARSDQPAELSTSAGIGSNQSTTTANMASSAAHPSPAESSPVRPIVSSPQRASAKENPSDSKAESSPGSPSAGSNSDPANQSSTSQQHDPPSLSTQSGDKSGGDSQSSSGDNQKSASKKSAASAQDSASSKENQGSKKGGSSGANSSQDGMNGNGKQPGGGNAPKKSRGVAPLMLGSRQPDLFEGKKLPGTDERTELPVPPQPTPESPAAAADTHQRTGDEFPVSPYLVPAEMRQVVSDYFRQFHSDTEPK